MRIKNPNFADPVAAYVAGKKNAIGTWLAGQPANKRFITPADIRAQFPADADRLTDGTIAELCKALGLSIEHGE